MYFFALFPETQNPHTPIESKNIYTTRRDCGLYGGAGVFGPNDHFKSIKAPGPDRIF